MPAASHTLTRIIAISAMSVTSFSNPVFAQDAQVGLDLGKYRIDIAGRQRMLSQRIAKEICFIELGYRVEEHHAMLEEDYHLFEDTLIELRDGGGQYNIEPETDRRTLAELDLVLMHWTPLKVIIEEVLESNQVTEEAEESVFDYNLVMLQDSNDMVSLIEQEYANPHTLEMADAFTLNLISRQTMLSQKAAKEFCYIATGHHVEEERMALAETRQLFTASQDAIANGLPAMSIAPPPTEEIAGQLAFVTEIWKPMDEIYVHISEGADVTDPEVEFISSESIHLLAEMSVATQMYVDH